MIKKVFLVGFVVALFFYPALSQNIPENPENEKEEETEDVFQEEELDPITDTPLTIDLYDERDEEDDEEDEDKKKKKKKNVFFGLKTKKGYTKSGFGNKVKIEIFHYLKNYIEPDPYVRDIYWYDFKDKRIRVSGKIDKKYGGILHGPYKVIQNEQVVEEGIFYIGTKHGRWTRHGKMYDYYVLIDKQKYFKGWPKESKVSYYDRERKKLKEVIPVEYGNKEGNYFYFHENGLVAVQGEFRNDTKVGKWVEYYQFRRRRKREIQYRNDPYNDQFEPFISKEWDEQGNLIYDKEALERRLSSR
ncbi:MAG: toxin-antitoxin system YwqK family antitoxin [Candidatus Cyclobacteriaceae bacterium M3_2C_046]